MNIKNIFKKPEPVVLTPMQRAEAAIDMLNAAVADFPQDQKYIRPYVEAGSARFHRRRCAKVMLGHWAANYVSNGAFVVTYPKEEADT
jgi:hypothetical protein